MNIATKRRLFFILVALGLGMIVAFLSGCGSDNATAQELPEEARQERVPAVTAFGIVRSRQELVLSAPFDLRLPELHVWEGQVFGEDEVLGRVDLDAYLRRRELVAADLERAWIRVSEQRRTLSQADTERATELKALQDELDTLVDQRLRGRSLLQEKLQGLREGSDPALQGLRTELERIRVEAGAERAYLERKERVRATGSVSAQELESIEATIASLELQAQAVVLEIDEWMLQREREITELESSVAELSRRIETQRERIAGLATPEVAALEVLQLEVKRLEGELAYETRLGKLSWLRGERIVVPFRHAVISEITASAGSFLEAGEPILTVLDGGDLYIDAELPEEFLREIGLGSPAMVRALAFPDESYAARVAALAGQAVLENGETVLKVRVELEEEAPDLRVGLNVDVEIEGNP